MASIENNGIVAPNSHEPIAGKIQKISLRNLSCHESTDLFLNDNVNFFVGPNGCGKSVMLTALAVGLGANLDRFGVTVNKEDDFLKGLVKHVPIRRAFPFQGPFKPAPKRDPIKATIEITLSNVGDNSYNPDVYGDSITICRTIQCGFEEPRSAFQIQNSSGETVTTEKSVLEDILKKLNIEVDNPICILNEDYARTFWIVSDASKMHNMLVKATKPDELEKVRNSFREILRLKNYTGSLTIDHNKQTLELKAIPASNVTENLNNEQTLPAETLAMVAFLLALLDCTKFPFYFLDEFDAFMIKAQRRLVMDMLLDFMKRRPQKQFGFFTPLDTAHIESDDTVSIHRLASPQGRSNNHNN